MIRNEKKSINFPPIYTFFRERESTENQKCKKINLEFKIFKVIVILNV